jgi:hypothetical protein
MLALAALVMSVSSSGHREVDEAEVVAGPAERGLRSGDGGGSYGNAQRASTAAITLSAVAELSQADLDELVEVAIVDANCEEEQLVGFYTMIENDLALPFTTTVLGVEVTVEGIDLADCGIAAICVHGTHRQLIAILELPLPTPAPPGSEWIAAYGRWAGRR